MRKDVLKNVLLLILTAAMVAVAVRPYFAPRAAAAQSAAAYPFYIEPGTQMLRAPDGSKQLYGRVVVDMRTGNIWGFPTYSTDTYPINPTDPKPQTSHPFLLGRFAFEETEK